jgi:peptidyl-prolyl cis-trans isomerase C
MSKYRSFHNQSGNALIIVLAVLVVVAVGALAYFSGKAGKIGQPEVNNAVAATAAADKTDQPVDVKDTSDAAEVAAPGAAVPAIKPGNPVVAKLKGAEVTRLEVFNFIQSLPPQTRQLPLEQLYPMALEQVINSKIIAEKTKDINLDNDAEVKKQLAEAKKQITRTVYIENMVNKKIDEKRLKDVYAEYVKSFPDVDDIKARHILVKDEAKAKDLIKELNSGKDFAELAKANSIDGTAASGGELGYFAKTEVVPAFADAAFALTVGEYSKKPVKTDFGYHIIKVEEKRKRPPAAYNDIKPYLETQVRRQILDETVQAWRDEANIERFDINGDPVEPSAGDEKAAEDKSAAPTSAPTAGEPVLAPTTPPAQ